MQTRKLGYSNLHLTAVGLGTWAIGGPWQSGWGPQDDKQAITAIHAALDQGINWIDTAPIYGLGHSEQLIGEALKHIPNKPFIATKCGLLWNKKKEKVSCLNPKSIREECHASLKRLGIEVIDLYQMHWPQPDRQIEQAWQEMAKLVKEGKVRYLGASNYNLNQLRRVSKIHPVACIQSPYSMLHREVENQLLPYCAQNNIGVICYSPMQKGLLTGKYNHKSIAALPDDDHRKRDPDFRNPRLAATLELLRELGPIARENSEILAQLAISWVLRRGEVTAAIVGARDPRQIRQTASAADLTLTQKDLDQIEQLLAQRRAKLNSK